LGKNGYKFNKIKLIAFSIIGLVFYFMLFIVVGINLRQQGISMKNIRTIYYVGLLLVIAGCSLASIEKKKD